MKIVFDLDGEPQVSATCQAYSFGFSRPPKYEGAWAEVLIVDCLGWDDNGKHREGDAIYIEGNITAIRRAFQQVLELLDANEGYERARVEQVAARSIICPQCQHWIDPEAAWHADGKGNRCPASREPREEVAVPEA